MSDPEKKLTDEERAFALDMIQLMRELEALRNRAKDDTVQKNLQEALDQMRSCLPESVRELLWSI